MCGVVIIVFGQPSSPPEYLFSVTSLNSAGSADSSWSLTQEGGTCKLIWRVLWGDCACVCVHVNVCVCHCVQSHYVMSSSLPPPPPLHRMDLMLYTYIIVSWDLPTHSNCILVNLIRLHRMMCVTLSVGQVLQSCPQALHSSWNVVLGIISVAASLPRYITSIT